MTSKLTRAELLNIIETDHVQCGEASALARMALAAMDSEPVSSKPFMYGIADPDGNAYIDEYCVSRDLVPVEVTVNELNYDREEGDELNYSVVPLYRHAQPAPVVPDDGRADFEAWVLRVHDGDISKAQLPDGEDYANAHTRCVWKAWSACRAAMLQAGGDEIGSWDNGKYPPSNEPAQQTVVPDEMAVTDEMTVTAQMFARGHNACRASILQHGVIPNWVPFDGQSPYDAPYKIPSNLRELIAEEIDILFSDDDAQGIWNACRAAMLQAGTFREIADTSTGAAITPASPDKKLTDDVLDEIISGAKTSMEQYLALSLKAERAAGNSPVIPGWIPVSERMPETDGNYWGWWSESKRQGPVWFIKSELQAQFQSSEITHWMPLPAAPQEVKGE